MRRIYYRIRRWIKNTKLFYQTNLIPTRIKLFNDKQYKGDDEFYHSYSMDASAMMKMNAEDRDKYLTNLMRRRDDAHRKDMEK